MKPRHTLTDAEVEAEITRLRATEEVKLARHEQNIRNRRRKALYDLRQMEKRGRTLMESGITFENMESVLFGDEKEEA